MEIENSFEVDAPLEQVWDYLLDVEKVVPCMPGAELVETIDDKSWKGKVTVKLGPVSLGFRGTVAIVERDDLAHRVVLKGSGMEQRGKGAASAVVTTTLEGELEKTRVALLMDVTLQGQAAQFSRGMMQDVTTSLTRQFADCLQKRMASHGGSARPAADKSRSTVDSDAALLDNRSAAPAAKPIGGVRLGAKVVGAAIARFFRRLFRRDGR